MPNKTVINSWNEWDPLKHVIVGVPDFACVAAPEPALQMERLLSFITSDPRG